MKIYRRQKCAIRLRHAKLELPSPEVEATSYATSMGGSLLFLMFDLEAVISHVVICLRPGSFRDDWNCDADVLDVQEIENGIILFVGSCALEVKNVKM